MAFPAFAAWAAAFGKVYNGAEAEIRESVYNANIEKIREHNSKGLSWTMGVNEFTDMTQEEFSHVFSTVLTPPSHFDEPSFDVPVDEDLEDSVDWVQLGKVNPVKDQVKEKCGSCWAFSSMGALESGYAIATGKLLSLAEQQLVDCDSHNNGCGGGWPATAYKYYLSNDTGVCSESSYAYKAKAGSCQASSCDVVIPKGTVTGATTILRTTTALKAALQKQPVSVTINYWQLQHYKQGIVTESCEKDVNHAVIAVGYGSDDGLDYFKIRNSFGPSWGEAGYFRLSQNDTAQGAACLFQMCATTPILSVSQTSVVI